jgi:2-oxoglutarate dehydrogenase complex dehydrogenase (E1) component-like enzyme
MGAWHYLFFHMRTAMRSIETRENEPRYIGRRAAASPATGVNWEIIFE